MTMTRTRTILHKPPEFTFFIGTWVEMFHSDLVEELTMGKTYKDMRPASAHKAELREEQRHKRIEFRIRTCPLFEKPTGPLSEEDRVRARIHTAMRGGR